MSTPQAARRSARPNGARPLVTSQEALEDSEHGYDQVIDLMATNVVNLSDTGFMQVISDREFDKEVDYIKFMEDPVVIEIHETTDVNAPRAVLVGVNGDMRWLPRGAPLRLQRKFVEKLAQAQEMRYETVPNDSKTSDNGFDTVRKTASAYQFSVLQDKHPLGRKWLLRVTRQGS